MCKNIFRLNSNNWYLDKENQQYKYKDGKRNCWYIHHHGQRRQCIHEPKHLMYHSWAGILMTGFSRTQLKHLKISPG